MRLPVWPTWSECGRQPLLVTTREQPTAPPSRLGQLLDRGEALLRADAPAAADDDRGAGRGCCRPRRPARARRCGCGRRRRPSVGRELARRRAVGRRPVGLRRRRRRAALRIRSLTGASRVDRSSRLPPHRAPDQLPRTVGHGDRGTTLAANGTSAIAADVGEHLVAAVGAGGDDRGRRSPRPRADGARRPRPRARSRSSSGWRDGQIRVAPRRRPRRPGRRRRADDHRLDGRRRAGRSRGRAERLERGLRGHAPVVLDQHEHRPAHRSAPAARAAYVRGPRSHCGRSAMRRRAALERQRGPAPRAGRRRPGPPPARCRGRWSRSPARPAARTPACAGRRARRSRAARPPRPSSSAAARAGSGSGGG